MCLGEVLRGKSGVREPERADGPFHACGVLAGYPQEEIDVARVARATMVGHGMRAHNDVFNAVGV